MNSTAERVVAVSSLTKDYGKLRAVDSLDLNIQAGELFGLIGPDGAGKTTIFHMLGGILDPTSGDLSVLGMPAREARLQIGYLTQQFSLYPDLSVEENMRYASGLRNVPQKDFEERKDYYLALMDLKRFSDRPAGNLSGGMKQKLALCCALIGRPQLLLLDEPTTGVDPVSRRDFWDVLASIAREGVTIAVATPYLDEAERCSRIALIHKGIVRASGSPAELKKQLGLERLEVRGHSIDEIRNLISGDAAMQSLVADIQEFGDRLDVLTSASAELRGKIESATAQRGWKLEIAPQEATLENVFTLTIKRSEPPVAQVPFPFIESEESGTTAIRATSLTKTFGTFRAVSNVNLDIGYGNIFGLLGANGAGKTTTIKMLCGLLEPSSGQMELAGATSDLRKPALRQKLGYMSQKFTLYEDLTVLENLRFYGGVYNVPFDLMDERIRWVLDTCNLAGSEDMLTAKLPGGFRQRLAFGATVLHQPEILFLDEPTSGVDPLARRQLWSLIRDFAKQGTAVLVTTHFLEEAEHCHNLAFMVAGEIVASGSPNQIKAEQPGQLFEIRTNENQDALDLLRKRLPRWKASLFGDSLHVVCEREEEHRLVLDELARASITVESERVIPFSLEDAFIGIVERQQRALTSV